MSRKLSLPTGVRADLDYFVEWRPWLWRRPIVKALKFLGDLHGRSVLEIGGRYGRMSSLLAMLGAEVTMLETAELDTAAREINKWRVADRVRLIQTAGGFEEIAGEKFDVVFTKSVLWAIEDLDSFLHQIDTHLADGGKVAFVENARGGRCIRWLRRSVIHHGRFGYENIYFGIRPDQLALFRRRFGDVRIDRHLWFVYAITGRKRRQSPRLAGPAEGEPSISS